MVGGTVRNVQTPNNRVQQAQNKEIFHWYYYMLLSLFQESNKKHHRYKRIEISTSCLINFSQQIGNIIAMIKQQVIYEEDSEIYQRRGSANQFILTDEHRNNVNKRLPRGFSLVKIYEFPKNSVFRGEIEYTPVKRQPRVASQDLNKQFLAQPMLPALYPVRDLGKSEVGVDKAGLRFSQLPEGKSKQAEKIKSILQRFRRHYRYPALAQYLQRMGFMNSFLEIQAQNKKNIHTIDSFKDRMMFVFRHLKEFTYDEGALNMISELVDEFLFHVEQARKIQFETNLNSIQKSIDRVTREISEIKESGNYYYRKKKRNQKNYDQKEILYIAELIRAVPTKQHVGIMEIIEEKPFQEISTNILTFDLSHLKSKKLREIQLYVKKKLSNYYRSRERKRDKMMRRKTALNAINIEGANEVTEQQGDSKMKRQESDRLGRDQPQLKQEAQAEPQIQCIFEFDQQPVKQELIPQDRSLFSLEYRSRNEFDDFLQDRPSELSFAIQAERSQHNQSLADKNEKIEENVEFELPDLMMYNYNAREEQQYDSSDSSMITDEEDSDY